jgi:hypothetical protein
VFLPTSSNRYLLRQLASKDSSSKAADVRLGMESRIRATINICPFIDSTPVKQYASLSYFSKGPSE